MREEPSLQVSEIAAAGYRTLRFTYRQVHDEPARVAQTLAAMLAPSRSSA